MSALIDELGQILPFAVVATSFLGSGHCVAMCGGLALSQAQDAESQAAYHLGRLAAYSGLGAVAAEAGGRLLSPELAPGLAAANAALVAGALIYTGIRMWRGSALHFGPFPRAWGEKAMKGSRGRPFLVGLSSALIPCGWLHAFLLSAAATRSAERGALLMGLFWLGTVPALAFAPDLARRALVWLKPARPRAFRATALLLIALGFLSLGQRWEAYREAKAGAAACHDPVR